MGHAAFGQQVVGDGSGLLTVFAAEGSPKDGNPRSLAHVFDLASHTRLMRLRPRAPERWLGRPLFSGNPLLIAAPSSPFGTVEASGKVYLIPKNALRGSAR
ncbi:MAG: hypothetical protein VCA73_05955 [Roseibacillus sp.]